MTKLFFAAAILVVGVMTWMLPKNAPTTVSVTSAAAMTAVMDADTGKLRAPTPAERQAISKQRQEVVSNKPKLIYSNTMKQYPDGTRTGVVDPMHTHNIYASRDQNGNIIIHEGHLPEVSQDIRVAK